LTFGPAFFKMAAHVHRLAPHRFDQEDTWHLDASDRKNFGDGRNGGAKPYGHEKKPR
jgi:hypothetical protein